MSRGIALWRKALRPDHPLIPIVSAIPGAFHLAWDFGFPKYHRFSFWHPRVKSVYTQPPPGEPLFFRFDRTSLGEGRGQAGPPFGRHFAMPWVSTFCRGRGLCTMAHRLKDRIVYFFTASKNVGKSRSFEYYSEVGYLRMQSRRMLSIGIYGCAMAPLPLTGSPDFANFTAEALRRRSGVRCWGFAGTRNLTPASVCASAVRRASGNCL